MPFVFILCLGIPFIPVVLGLFFFILQYLSFHCRPSLGENPVLHVQCISQRLGHLYRRPKAAKNPLFTPEVDKVELFRVSLCPIGQGRCDCFLLLTIFPEREPEWHTHRKGEGGRGLNPPGHRDARSRSRLQPVRTRALIENSENELSRLSLERISSQRVNRFAWVMWAVWSEVRCQGPVITESPFACRKCRDYRWHPDTQCQRPGTIGFAPLLAPISTSSQPPQFLLHVQSGFKPLTL